MKGFYRLYIARYGSVTIRSLKRVENDGSDNAFNRFCIVNH